MKKLKNKVFFIIFSLLTIFTLIIFITTTTRSYIERRNSISDMLTKIPRTFNNNVEKEDKKLDFNPSRRAPSEDPRRIYLDFTIYTIVLDDNGNYQELINHTNDDEVDEEYIKKIANEIIKNHEDKLYIGNLYTSKYAYVFTPNNTLIIMDNTKVNSTLINQLISNILLFLLCEVVIFVITYFITKWIITPVKNS